MQAVVLAGGKGTRLAERLNGRPKPLIDVAGVPLLERQILFLRHYGVDDVVVLVNHKAEQIVEYCREREDFGIRLTLVDDGDPRGTAGAVLATLDRLAERFLVVYGDTMLNVDIGRFVAAHRQSGADVTLFLHPNDHPFDSDLVELDGDRIVAFHAKPHPPGSDLQNMVNAALYVVEKSALERWADFTTPADFAHDLFPAMLTAGQRLGGYVSFEYVKDLGTPRRLDKVEADFRRGVVERASLSEPQACVFVDRDGTLNALDGHVSRPDQIVLLPGAAEAVKRLNQTEFRVALVTNQPVIARGDCTFADMRRILGRLDGLLEEAGAWLDRVYFCPHHPDAGFPGEVPELKIRCDCRKPAPGMILRASADLNADPKRSWMIGDSTADLAAGRAAGVRTILVRTGEGGRDAKYAVHPDYVADDFAAAVDFVVERHGRLSRSVASLAERIAAGGLVLIAGRARSGKSTVAQALAEALRGRGETVHVVHLDDWLAAVETRAPAAGLEQRFESGAAIAALDGWLRGGTARVVPPFYERHTRTRREGEPFDVAPGDIVLLEGIPALLPSTVERIRTSRSVTKISVEAGEDGRRQRVASDLMRRGVADAASADAISIERAEEEAAALASVASVDVVFRSDEIFQD